MGSTRIVCGDILRSVEMRTVTGMFAEVVEKRGIQSGGVHFKVNSLD